MSDTMLLTTAAVTGGVFVLAFAVRRLLFTANAVSTLSDLSSFIQEEVLLQSDTVTILLGRFAWQRSGQSALVKLYPKSGAVADVAPSLDIAVSSYSGAEYAYYNGRTSLASLLLRPSLRQGFSVEVIAPASEKQISRSRPQPSVFIVETAATYKSVVAPYIESLDPNATSWIYKCLDLSKEKERVLYNDTDPKSGFLLNVDTKWKSHPDCHAAAADPSLKATWRHHDSVKDLYCLAICHRRDLRSLRDLTREHLPLLRHIRDAGVRTLCEVYGVTPADLRVFVHYQPQFYHFHVHFTRLHNDLGCQVERAHLLHEIIDTLESGDGTAYKETRTLYYQLKANDKLLAKLNEAGALEHGTSPVPQDAPARRKQSPARRKAS